jgi:hypothetical protein
MKQDRRVGHKSEGAGYRMLAEPLEVAKAIQGKTAKGNGRVNLWAPPRENGRDMREESGPSKRVA